jgi:hypothetical protein
MNDPSRAVDEMIKLCFTIVPWRLHQNVHDQFFGFAPQVNVQVFFWHHEEEWLPKSDGS